MVPPLEMLIYNEGEFFEKQRFQTGRWLLAINLAVAIHVLVFFLSMYLPVFLNRKPLLDEEIITVSLVSLPQEQEQAVEKAPEPAPEPEATVVPESEPVRAESDRPAIQVAPQVTVQEKQEKKPQPISLKPLKRKIRKARDTRLEEEKERQRLARERKQRELARQRALARAREEERRAREAERRAREEARKARQAVAAMIKQKGVASLRKPAARGGAGAQGRREVRSLVEKQYYAALYERVHRYWVLPEMRKWDSSLETVVVLTIGADGTILDKVIERKSRDPFFDQFVMKTLEKAAPMPRFPKLLQAKTIEIGFRFRPGELTM